MVVEGMRRVILHKYFRAFVFESFSLINLCGRMELPWWLSSEESPCNAGATGNVGLIPGSGRSSLEDGMAVHSSILAWRIPWTEESGGLLSIGLHRVGYD